MNKRFVIIAAVVAVIGVTGTGLALRHPAVAPVAAQLHFADQPNTDNTQPADTPPATTTDTVQPDTTVAPTTPTDTTTPLTADQQVLKDTGSDIQVTCFDQIMTYRYGDSLTADRQLQKVTDIEDAQYNSFCQALQQVKQFPKLSTQPLPGFQP